MAEMPQRLSILKLRQVLDVSGRYVQCLIDQGSIKGHRLPSINDAKSERRVPLMELLRFIRSNKLGVCEERLYIMFPKLKEELTALESVSDE